MECDSQPSALEQLRQRLACRGGPIYGYVVERTLLGEAEYRVTYALLIRAASGRLLIVPERSRRYGVWCVYRTAEEIAKYDSDRFARVRFPRLGSVDEQCAREIIARMDKEG